jgi:hypothetical protein
MNLLAHVSSFKGQEAFVIACDDEALRWLANRFDLLKDDRGGADFVIGDDHEIGSDGKIEIMVRKSEGQAVTRLNHKKNKSLDWFVSVDCALRYQEKLLAMLSFQGPCHNYFDVVSDNGNTIPFVITKGEYHIETIRAMRDASHF